jgi:predicted small lipoprotein YifL
MKTGLSVFVTSATLACVIALAGCGAAPPDEPAPNADPPATQTETTRPSDPADAPEPVNLLDELKAANYTKWTPAPGNESRVAAKGPHGDEVQILLDPTAEEGLASGGDRWPLESIIAKDIFRNGELIQIAAMKKTADGWYWGEWDAQGKPIAEGIAVEPCEGCHASGTDGTLGVVLK